MAGWGNQAGALNRVMYLARMYRASDRLADAQAVLSAGLNAIHSGLVAPRLRVSVELATINARLGKPTEAGELVKACRSIIDAGEDWRGKAGRVALAEAVLRAARGQIDSSSLLFDEAVKTASQFSCPLDEADALIEWGRALAVAGEGQSADCKFETADAVYDRIGAGARWHEHVEREAQGARPPTSRERRPRLRIVEGAS